MANAIGLVNRQGKALQNLNKGQALKERQLFSQYRTAIGRQEKLPDVFRQAQEEAGVQDLRSGINLFNEQSQGVKSLIDRLPENLAERTQGTFTTQGQRDRQLAVEQGDLNTQLSRLTEGLNPLVQAYGMASGDIGQLLEATYKQNMTELDPYQKRIEVMSDGFARQLTGFTNQKQNELTALLDKLERQRYLSDREWEEAQKRAAEEREYARQKSLIADQNSSLSKYLKTLNQGGGGGQTRGLPTLNTGSLSQGGNSGMQGNFSGSLQGSTPYLQGGR